ncbi:MAG: mechanosensitive ion channel domain-containing protein [Pseudomonadota bacterium]
MSAEPAVQSLLDALLSDLSNTILMTQAGVLIAALVLGWFAVHRLVARLSPLSRDSWHAGEWPRFLVPLATLFLVLVARPLVAGFQSVHLLDLAVPLLLSMAIIQSTFFFLRSIVQPSPALRAVERVVSWMVWGAVALHILGYLDKLVAGMDAIGFTLGKQHISLYTALLGLITIAVTLIASLSLGRLVEHRLIAATQLSGNMKVALSKLVRTLLTVVAVLIALPMVGIDLTVLSVFGGALGVGLGLGLQKIASNYVSGFTLLLEQSLRLGDMVEVAGRYGEVTRIATRYTVLRDLDGTETILPNETLITAPVINRSLTDKDNRIFLPMQVGYGSDLDQVKDVMLAAAHDCDRVLKEPTPAVFLKRFGDNGIDMELAVWIDTPEAGERQLVSDLNWAMWRGFQAAGIEIPYPQRVVHMAKAMANPGVAEA